MKQSIITSFKAAFRTTHPPSALCAYQKLAHTKFPHIRTLYKVPQYTYFGENLLFKFKVLSNLDNLIEDDRKADFFTTVVNKYGENNIDKVKICAKEVLKLLDERTFKAKVREELLVALINPKQQPGKPYFFEVLQLRLELIEDYISMNLKSRANAHLIHIKEVYKKLEEHGDPVNVSFLAHSYVMSNIQINNYDEALTFAKILRRDYEKMLAESTTKKIEKIKILEEGLSLSYYYYQIYIVDRAKFNQAMNEFQAMISLCKQYSGESKLCEVISPMKLNQFQDFMLHVFEVLISKQMYEKATEPIMFYANNMFTNKQIIAKFNETPKVLRLLQYYFQYLTASSKKFENLTTISTEDQSIYAHSVQEYYKYATRMGKIVGLDIQIFKLHDQINKVTTKKFSKKHSDQILAHMYDFDLAIDEQKAENYEDPRKPKKQ